MKGRSVDEMIVRFPVVDLEGRCLLSAGSRLDSETLQALSSSSPPEIRRGAPITIGDYGSVRRDLLGFLKEPPYRIIFDEGSIRFLMGAVMDGCRFPLPVLRSLGYFKINDSYTYRHILLVFALSSILGKELLEDDRDWIPEAMAGHMHDIGKVSVPVPILQKTCPLIPRERAYLEHHTVAGFVLLCHYLGDGKHLAARVARDHHERRNGTGYPRGILLEDRLVEIVAACDIYDALISQRPYRDAPYENRSALEELTHMARRGELSWEVVRILVAYNRTPRPPFQECTVSTERRGKVPKHNLYGVVAEEDEPEEDT